MSISIVRVVPRAAAILALHCVVACDTPAPDSGADLGAGGTMQAGSGGAPSGGGSASSGGVPGTGGLASGGSSSADGGSATGGGAPSGGGSGSGGETGDGGAGSGGAGGTTGFAPCPPVGSPCVVLPLGDSITEGYASSGGGYRVELFRQALDGGKTITFVGAAAPNGPPDVDGTPFPRSHEGHGGFTIDTDSGHSGISGAITENALDDFGPHIVLLMIGTNDINGNVDVDSAPQRLGNLIDDITTRAPDTLVVVASIVPVINTSTDAKIVQYNAGVQQVVLARAAEGAHAVFVDNYATIHQVSNWQTELMADNLHPNDAGYAALGQSFFGAISEYLP